MFAATTKAVVKTLGAQDDLISNTNVNDKMETLTLVKVRKGTLWPIISYTVTDQTLLDLLEDADSVSAGVSSHTLSAASVCGLNVAAAASLKLLPVSSRKH